MRAFAPTVSQQQPAVRQSNGPMHLVTITPVTAEAWLRKNVNNRTIRTQHVTDLARAMAEGTFLVNGDCIRFDTNGNLIDGQHRLLASIRSGCSFQAYVIYNLPVSVTPTIDRNRLRSSADSLRMMHGVKDQNVIACTITMLLRLRDPDTLISQGLRPTPQEVEQFYEQNSVLLERVPSIVNRVRHLCTPSVSGACYTLFSLAEPTLAQKFFDELADGEGLQRSNPVYILRDRLMRDRRRSGRRTSEEILVLLLKTWAAYVSGNRLAMLSWNPDREEFATVWKRSGLTAI